MEKVTSSMEQTLEKQGFLLITASGNSMLPCIRPQRDAVVLERQEGRAGKRDVILYKRKNDTYILHRILEVRENSYVLCGDNQYVKEYGVEEEQVLAVLKGFYRNGRYIDCEKNAVYRCYVRSWCASITLRKCILRGVRLCKRVLRK